MRKMKDYVVYYRVVGYRKTEVMEYIAQGINADIVKRAERERLYPNFVLVDVKLLKNVISKNSMKEDKIDKIEKYITCNI